MSSSLSSLMYDCPCGKKHKSRNTVSRHRKKLSASKTVPSDVPKDVPKGQEKDRGQDGGQDSATSNHDASFKGQSFIKEINLKGEFDKMTETVNPKKPENTEPKYECGSCHGTFNEKHKRCPHCGAEF